jgi:hypothetical protein
MKIQKKELEKFEKRGEKILTGRTSFDKKMERIERRDNKFFDRQAREK